MRFLPTKVHAALDYAGGLLLIAVPMFWIGEGGAAVWVPIVIGVVVLMQSLMTDYELSAVNAIPVPVHLGMDALAGVVLIASPWVFGFSETVWIPHVIVGILEIGGALVTERHRREPATAGPGSRRATPA